MDVSLPVTDQRWVHGASNTHEGSRSHLPISRKESCSRSRGGFSSSRTSGLHILMASPIPKRANEKQTCTIPSVNPGASALTFREHTAAVAEAISAIKAKTCE